MGERGWVRLATEIGMLMEISLCSGIGKLLGCPVRKLCVFFLL